MLNRFVAYYRVSTQRQGASGLGLEAQREAVRQYLAGTHGETVAEFVEIESGRKTELQRPQLAAALAECKSRGAVLLVAKLDRLARSVHFVSGLMQAGVKFVAVDLPEANDLTLHVMAAFAEHEAKRISQRTKDALAMAKARGTLLGTAGPTNLKRNVEERQQAADAFASRLQGVVLGMNIRGLTQRQMVIELNSLAIHTPRGGTWSLVQLQRLLGRLQDRGEARGSTLGISVTC